MTLEELYYVSQIVAVFLGPRTSSPPCVELQPSQVRAGSPRSQGALALGLEGPDATCWNEDCRS